jgi:hypothetical protein
VLALLAASCTSDDLPSTTTRPAPATAESSTTIPLDPALLTIHELTGITEDLRELEFLAPPEVVLVTGEELSERVRALIVDEIDMDETHRDELLLQTLGLVEEGVDLAALYADLYSEQVAGYYDDEVGELVVPARAGDFTELQRMTLVHELTHALTDQHFDFSQQMTALDDAQRFEEAAALSAVIEGDASLTEVLYLGSLSRDAQLDVLDRSLKVETAVFDRTPRFLQELLLFPYTTGSDFVGAIWESGGFDAVNGLYRDAPTTTEHIFHPSDFLVGEPSMDVVSGSFVPEGYEIAEASTWGQAGFRAMFGQALDDRTATVAAVGWGGDAYRLLWDGADEIVFDLVFVADSTIDATEMFDTLSSFVVQQIDAEIVDIGEGFVEVSGEDFADVRIDGGVITLVVATNPEVGRLVAGGGAP